MTYRLIVIKVSLGGLQALPVILAGLPVVFLLPVVQDLLTAANGTMPRAAIAASKVDEILSLEEIAGRLCSWAAAC